MLDRLGIDAARRILSAAKNAYEAKAALLDKGRVLDRNRDGEAAIQQLDESQGALIAAGDSRQAALREELSRLSREQLHELAAIVQIGRGEFAPSEWAEAFADAQMRSTAADVDRLSDNSALHDELAKGLHLLELEAPAS